MERRNWQTFVVPVLAEVSEPTWIEGSDAVDSAPTRVLSAAPLAPTTRYSWQAPPQVPPPRPPGRPMVATTPPRHARQWRCVPLAASPPRPTMELETIVERRAALANRAAESPPIVRVPVHYSVPRELAALGVLAPPRDHIVRAPVARRVTAGTVLVALLAALAVVLSVIVVQQHAELRTIRTSSTRSSQG